jgi:myo-inositol-1-phosphate synthase
MSSPEPLAFSGLNTPQSEPEPIIHPTAARADHPIHVESDKTTYTDDYITSTFDYRGQSVTNDGTKYIVKPTLKTFEFRTARKVPRTGYVFPESPPNPASEPPRLSAAIL